MVTFWKQQWISWVQQLCWAEQQGVKGFAEHLMTVINKGQVSFVEMEASHQLGLHGIMKSFCTKKHTPLCHLNMSQCLLYIQGLKNSVKSTYDRIKQPKRKELQIFYVWVRSLEIWNTSVHLCNIYTWFRSCNPQFYNKPLSPVWLHMLRYADPPGPLKQSLPDIKCIN